MLYTILSILAVILWIVAIIDIVGSPMDTVKKLIWILIVLFLPFIGTILWFLVGKKM